MKKFLLEGTGNIADAFPKTSNEMKNSLNMTAKKAVPFEDCHILAETEPTPNIRLCSWYRSDCLNQMLCLFGTLSRFGLHKPRSVTKIVCSQLLSSLPASDLTQIRCGNVDIVNVSNEDRTRIRKLNS